MIDRRKLSLFAGIAVGAVVLAACGPSASPGITKQAETITLGMQQEPDTLFVNIGSMMARTIVLGALYSPLVRENDKPEFIAWGAESKPTVQNGGAKFVGDGTAKHLEVTFKIKVQKWHDGTPVTADDARFGWELVLNPKFPANQRDTAEKLWDLTVVDSKTLVAKFMSEEQALKAAAVGLAAGSPSGHPIMKDAKEFTDYKDWKGKGPVVDPLYFTFGDWLLGPKAVLSAIKPEDMAKSSFANKPVYNGPYKLKEWVKGQQMTLEANPDYFQGAPKIKNMVFKFVKDASVFIAGLRAGELDVATQIGLDLDNKNELDPLQDRYNVYYIPGTKWEHIDFNLSNPALGDIHVRKAIAYGINRKAIVDNLLFGKSEVANAFIPDWHPFYKPNASKVVKYAYDPAKADQELKDAGYAKGSDGIYAKGGQKLALKLSTTDATLRKQTGELIRKDLEKMGIKADAEYLIARNFFAGAGRGPLSNRTYQLGMYTWLASYDPDSEGLYLGSRIPSASNGYTGSNYPGYSGADDLIRKADLTADIVVNEPERIKVYGDILKQWTTDLPVLPLFLRVSPMVARKDMKNFRPTKTSAPETWNCFEWELPAK
jgi:peptide/nickel transport system substrate-binding protein